MKTISADTSWVNSSGLRLDSKFHLSQGRLTKLTIENSPYPLTSIGKVSKDIFFGGRAKRIYVTDPAKGVPFMGSADMLKSDFESLKFISSKHTADLQSYFVDEGWTLISRSGTIGNTVYVNRDFENKAASEHIIRVVPNGKLFSGFIYAYLTSKYGYSLLTQGTFGAVIQHIEPQHVEGLPIPIFPVNKQKEIHLLIKDSSDLRGEANSIISNLVKRINDLVRANMTNLKTRMSIRSISDVACFEKRLDAPFNVGTGRLIYDKIISEKFVTLSSVSEVFHPMLFGKKQMKGSELRGNPLYKSSSMMKKRPETDFMLSLKKEQLYSKLQVKEGWVLISRTGTVGNVVRINKSMNGVFIDDHMIRVKPIPKYSGLIYIYLKSFYGQRLIEFQKYGSVQEQINSGYIERIPIPYYLLSDTLLSELNELVVDASNKIDKAILAEKKAVDKIEKEIESWQK